MNQPNIYIQRANDLTDLQIPADADLIAWSTLALPPCTLSKEVTIRIISPLESQTLNDNYRKQNKPTNVLAFPINLPEEFAPPTLGDLAICAEIVNQEANEQNKTLDAHWAHMVIHGTLHLIGYDHIEPTDAIEMEAKETTLLAKLGCPNPYEGVRYHS